MVVSLSFFPMVDLRLICSSECIHCGNACSQFLTNTLPTGIHVYTPQYFDLNWVVLCFSGFVVIYLRPATDLRNWFSQSVLSTVSDTRIILHTFNSLPNRLQFDIWGFLSTAGNTFRFWTRKEHFTLRPTCLHFQQNSPNISEDDVTSKICGEGII